MCGIVGFVGKSREVNAGEVVFEGLKNLEYRGYDSWGVAVKDKGRFKVQKKVGKINSSSLDLPASNLAIGHTRWATHGGVTVTNAHPHLDCSGQIALVHNGIIENFEEIKKELLKKRHKFVSETDTEVTVHLIEEYLKVEGFVSAVRRAFNSLKGLNAIVVAYTKSQEIVAVKNGSPLIMGTGKGFINIASDIAGLSKDSKKIVFISDNSLAVLGKTFKLLDLPSGKEIQPKYYVPSFKLTKSDKGKFPHFLLKEIYEQPKIIGNIAKNFAKEAKKLSALIHSAFGTFMLGSGTAAYAAQAGAYLFSQIAKKHLNFAVGSEFKYSEHYIKSKTLVLAISQSGETIDILDAVKKIKPTKAKIATLVNVFGSTLYRESDYQFLLSAGPEKAVLATKSFTAMVAVLLFTAYALIKKDTEAKKLLQRSADNIKKILDKKYLAKIKKLARRLVSHEHIFAIGRGPSYPLAMEAALKIKEASYIHAEGFAGGELKHGPIALITRGTPCLVFAPNDQTFDDILSNAQEIKARGGYIVGIGPKKSHVFNFFLKTDDLVEATFLPQIVICQLLAYYLAILKNLDPDKPRNLAKSVTVK